MNQVIIGTAALRAALLSLRTRAEGAEDPAGYYEGGIDMLTALLPEGEVAEARPAIPAMSPPMDPRIADAIRTAEDDELRTGLRAARSVRILRGAGRGEPTFVTCRTWLPSAQKQEFPWTFPDGTEAFASLDDLLPDAPLATPIAVFFLPKAQALWVVAISEGAKLLWFSFDSEADALAYCADIDPPTGTTAEPSASLGPAPVEEARPADEPEALPPPLLPAAEGDEVPEADHAPPGDLAGKRGRQGDRPSPVWPPARIALLSARYPHEGATPELLADLNAITAEVPISSLGALKAKVSALGLRVGAEAAARIAEKTAATAREGLARKRAADLPPSAPTPRPNGQHPIPAAVTGEDEVKAEVFEAFDKGLSVRDIAADFGEPIAKLSAWRAEWSLARKHQVGTA